MTARTMNLKEIELQREGSEQTERVKVDVFPEPSQRQEKRRIPQAGDRAAASKAWAVACFLLSKLGFAESMNVDREDRRQEAKSMTLRSAAALMLVAPSLLAAAPQLTIPRTTQAPALDGRMADGEWDDAAATTGLLSQFGQAAHPRQAVFWLKYDDTNMYVACRSTVFPEEQEPKSPQTWFGRDSSIVVGLAPNRIGRGITPSHFLLRVNIDNQQRNREIFWTLEGGGVQHGYQDVKLTFPHPNWSSGTVTRHNIENGVWNVEMSIPLKDLKAADLKDGEDWGLLLGRDYTAADQSALTLSSDWRFGDGNRHYGLAFYNHYRFEKEYGRMKLGGAAPAVQLLELGDFTGGKPAPTVAVKNTTGAPVRVVVRCAYRIAYGMGGSDHPQEQTLELGPCERKTHTFKPVALPPGEPSVCVVTVKGPDSVLLKQEITMRPGWGGDRAEPTPEPYFCGYHLGPQPKTLLPTCYNPIANRVYGRVRPAVIPNGHLVRKAELTVRRSGEMAPVATVPIPGKPDYRIRFHDSSWWRSGQHGSPPKPATVLEWVAPTAGTVDIEMEFSNQAEGGQAHDGVALQVVRYQAAEKQTTVLAPRFVNNDPVRWSPVAAKGVAVQPGDKIHFYYDRNKGEGCDDGQLRGALTLTVADGTKTVYDPGGEFTPGKQGGTTGVWFYRWDSGDSTPNADGNYPELLWQKRYNHLKQQVYPEAFNAIDHNREPQAHQALIDRVIAGTDWVFDSEIDTLTPGVYEATVTLYSEDERVLGRARQTFIRYDHAKDLPWLGNKVGVTDKALPPWTPVRKVSGVSVPASAKATAGAQVSGEESESSPDTRHPNPETSTAFSIWGRTYTVDGSGLFTEIDAVAQAGLDQAPHDILAAPVRFEMVQDGEMVAFEPEAAPSDVEVADHEASWKGAVNGNGWRIETAVTLEYDGYALHRLRIIPPEQDLKPETRTLNTLDALRLVIPLKPEYATHLHAVGGGHFRGTVATMALEDMTARQSTYEFQKRGLLWDSQLVTGGGDRPFNTLVNPSLNEMPYYFPYGRGLMTVGSFRPYVWVGGAGRGLAFMADNDRGWVPDDPLPDHKFRGFAKTPAIEVVRMGPPTDQSDQPDRSDQSDHVAIVLNLVARPFTFDHPREITFSLQATPVRPLPDDVRERQTHIAMGTAFPGGRHGGTGWAWTGQMYSIKDNLDPGKSSWLFGLPGSALYPANWDMSAWYRETCQEGKGFHAGRLAYTPYQSQICVMTWPEVDDPRMPAGLQNGNTYGYIYPHIAAWHLDAGSSNLAREDMEYRIWNYKNWIEHCNLEGIYFDQTQPTLAANPAAGLGYRLDLPDRPKLHDRVQPGFGLTNIREMYKRLRTLFVENGVDEPYVFVHTTDANMVSAFAFALYLLEGENYPYITREKPISAKIHPTRQQTMRASAGGLALLQMEMADFRDPLVHRDVTGWLMLHDTYGSGMANLHYNWAGLDARRRADFLPYWLPQVAAALKTPQPDIFASAWRQDNALRVLVYNRNNEPVDASVQLDLAALGLTAGDKPFTAGELEPAVKPEERGAGELKAETAGGNLTVTVPVLGRNYRLFKVEPQP